MSSRGVVFSAILETMNGLGEKLCPCCHCRIMPAPSLLFSRDRLHGAAILLVGFAGGWLVMHLGIPAGLFMGCMVFSGIYRLATPAKIAGIGTFHKVGQILIAIVIGASFRQEVLEPLKLALLPVFVQIVVLVAAGFLLGTLLSKWTRLDHATSLLSSLPGGLPVMVGLAADLNHKVHVVAVIHFFRLTVIVFTMPTLIAIVTPFTLGAGGGVPLPIAEPMSSATLLFVIGIGIGCYLLTSRLSFPGADMLIPLLITGGINLFYYEIGPLNPAIKQVAITLLAVSVGARLSAETLKTLKQVLLPAASIILVLVALGISLGFVLYWITPLDLITALLSSVPGGAASLTAVADDLGGDLRIVASLHLCRLIFLSVLMPPVFLLMERFRET